MKKNRAKNIKKARNMRKNNGVGRTAKNEAIFNAKHVDDAPVGLGSKLAAGFKNLLGGK